MNTKHILSLTALLGALVTSGVAAADDHWERRRADVYQRDYRAQSDLDVIGTARLDARRGTAIFKITPGVRRDGLQLATDARRLRVESVELEYSDGFVDRLGTNDLRTDRYNGLLTIQMGRPPGLRVVRIRYTIGARDRGASLQLIQMHGGDGYTDKADIREGERRRRYQDANERYDWFPDNYENHDQYRYRRQ
jgi:hypothetical protein